MRRIVLLLVGVAFTGLGLVGAILPVLPTTPFLLVAAVAFAHSSPRLHAWLEQHPQFGPGLRRIREGKGIARRTKIVSLVLATLLLGGFAIFAVERTGVRLVLLLVLVLKYVVVAVLPTYVPGGDAGPGAPSRNNRDERPHRFASRPGGEPG